jgi:putative addiction module killer protein
MQPQKRSVLHYVVAGNDLFADWLEGLVDIMARATILKRIDRVEEGNFGDHRSVGQGVWELRIHSGPGYRVYYGEDSGKIILLLCGGAKRSQTKDIRRAHKLWSDYGRGK